MQESIGFSHFLAQTDAVGRTILAILVAMSIASWYLILTKAIAHARVRRRSEAFLRTFWNATSLEAVAHEINTHGARDPFAHLTSHALFAREHHARFGAAKLEEAGTASDFLTRTVRKVIDEETARLENGLTLLASVGSTAPFVGLFGTVWGVYHALAAIGMSGAGTLDKVAGPVGEALIMTGIGLAVAIPAVLAYNSFTRGNRVLLARLDAFAYDLFAFLTTGQPLDTSGNVLPLKSAGAAAAPAAARVAGGAASA
jgi:biopolymer transport protein ExbB